MNWMNEYHCFELLRLQESLRDCRLLRMSVLVWLIKESSSSFLLRFLVVIVRLPCFHLLEYQVQHDLFLHQLFLDQLWPHLFLLTIQEGTGK
jgi:hypothetical protein